MKRIAILAAILGMAWANTAAAQPQPRPPHYALWLCVHTNERSSWHDPNSPYWGGLQLSWGFFTHTHLGRYLLARKGTPEHWSVLEQMWVAEEAFQASGFSVSWFNDQWPPSAGRCGL